MKTCFHVSAAWVTRASTMEVQLASEELSEAESWSRVETFVLLGWLFWLITCCAWLRNLFTYCKNTLFPRRPESREVAGPQERSHLVNASTQTVLCTPPSSLNKEIKQKEHRTTTPEPIAVYSSFRRGGNREMLTRDMVVRALPVLEDMEQRLEMARRRESWTES